MKSLSRFLALESIQWYTFVPWALFSSISFFFFSFVFRVISMIYQSMPFTWRYNGIGTYYARETTSWMPRNRWTKLFSSYYDVRTSRLNAFCACIHSNNQFTYVWIVGNGGGEIVVMLNDIAKILNDVLFSSHQTYRTTMGNNQCWERKMQIDTHPYKFLISIIFSSTFNIW